LSIEQTNKNLIREMNDSQKEIKNYTKSVEKTNKELDNFAYIVSHDLKAPLRAISSLSDWIQEDLGDNINEDAAETFKLLKSRVSRMELLINGILEYSRAGRANTPIVDVNINQLINDVIFLLDPPSHIKITTLGFMPVVQADKVKLQQVFSNILGNAIKYNDKAQGEISISCQQMLNSWKFVISDNGPGIEEQYRTKVFDIFQTLHSKDKMESTGVGLAIVKKIIEECEGEIYITSSEYGGASFVFSIPKEPVNLTGASTFNLKTA
jgi:light-regulated signal transduction histidine kinase (bacteriophytochrome)